MGRKRKHLMAVLGIVLLMLIIGALLFIKENDTDTQRQEERLPQSVVLSTVQVSVEGMQGSGVIWKITDEKIIVLTAAHVVASRTEGDILLADNTVRKAFVTYVSSEFDLAFMEADIEGEGSPSMPYTVAEWDRELFDSMENGDNIYAVGYAEASPELRQGNVLDMWIYVEDFASYMTWGRMEGTQPGMSGGGVYDTENRLIGILCGAAPEGEIAVLPLSIILTEASLVDGL